MTTTRDDIAGLSERLRSPVWNDETMKGWDSWREMIIKNRGSLPRDCFESFLDGIDEERAEAAAKLDALQARVKELETDFAKLTDMAKESEALRKNALAVAEQWQARADALQARVKELEDECFRLAADTCHAGYGDEHGHHRCREVDQANARALRAEQERADEWSRRREAESQRDVAKAAVDTLRQERDEAYERAIQAVRDERLIDPVDSHDQTYNDALGHAEQAIRRLAGPEKEGNDE